MNLRHVSLTTAALLLLARPAFPWGATGHRVVGRIAEHHLSEAAARGVAGILGPESLAQVATWPDEIRSDPAWDRAKPWHFLSVDDGETYETTARDPQGDVVEAIGRFSKVLRDPAAARADRAEALRFLVHFVGDVHQPLHVGRRDDRGGNSVRVNWFGENTNLHAVWDEKILEAEKLSFSELALFLDHPTDGEIQAWQSAGVVDWAKESIAVRARVYDIGDGKLSYAYQYVNVPLVKRRLLQAGVRLAGLLNSIFAETGPSIPDRPPLAPPHQAPAEP
ncbi:MAG TPA: S1/P1 nuclease [Thermoanaerobaculia bacterium]|nr:S1/P1 nuclease [Thermoanaerobaculia bacterium]